MGQTIKGPFDFKYGANTLAEIEEAGVNYDVDSDDVTTVQGHSRTFFGAHKVSVEATFLESDVPSLAVALPQYYVANGEVLSTGETVTDAEGAIDIVPGGCNAAATSESLIISSCGTGGQVARILECTTEFMGFGTFDDKRRSVKVMFTGNSDNATIQFFKKNAISVVS